ncbi:MAG: hypothetical protein HWE20_15375 [Gammaproteobacteria bacterium]|nr:hypothetical protein [Gammaproteobacteria bacterium]
MKIICLGLYLAFIANAVYGAVNKVALLSDVQELLVLLAASVSLALLALKAESQSKSESRNPKES